MFTKEALLCIDNGSEFFSTPSMKTACIYSQLLSSEDLRIELNRNLLNHRILNRFPSFILAVSGFYILKNEKKWEGKRRKGNQWVKWHWKILFMPLIFPSTSPQRDEDKWFMPSSVCTLFFLWSKYNFFLSVHNTDFFAFTFSIDL